MSRLRTRPSRGGAARSRLGLSDATRSWAIDNLADGVAAPTLVAELVRAGVPKRVALAELAALSTSPLLPTLRNERGARAQLEQLVALRRRLEHDTIQRCPTPSADEFYAHYFHANRPCVLPSFTEGWPARGWTPEGLAERLGDAEIEVVRGRDAYPADYDRRSRQLAARMPFRDYVALVRATSPTNDHYSVAHNRTMDRPAFAALLEDVVIDDAWFDRGRLAGGTAFWFGPAGTVTPLHHDTTNILFCQLYGRKELTLVSPLEASLLGEARGFYSTLRASSEPFPGRRHRVVLEPGDALFLPVGWWHEVRALDVSLSFSLLAFRRPNVFDEYQPGFVRDG